MQPSFTPHQTPSAGVHGWSPVASGVTLLHTAYHWWTGTTMGTLPAQADSRADHAAPPARLGADIAALLDMPRETDAADFEAARPKRDRTSPQDRKGSLDTQQALVRHWLAKPHMLTRLADLGLSVGDVEASVLRNIANFEAGLPVRVMAGAHTGLVTYPQRPRAHDLLPIRCVTPCSGRRCCSFARPVSPRRRRRGGPMRHLNRYRAWTRPSAKGR